MKKRITSFTTGFLTAVLLLALCTTALAASGKVSYNFANVALNGETKITAGADIAAANGQKVPGSILFTDAAGGKTNYLPIRAVSELLGVEIGYDSATKTVLLGEQPGSSQGSSSNYEEQLKAQLEEARKIAYQDLEGASEEMRAKILEARKLIINNTSWAADGYDAVMIDENGNRVPIPHFSDLFPGWDMPAQ
nr:hypothetical protein [uncultured Oscillibacter sp.]